VVAVHGGAGPGGDHAAVGLSALEPGDALLAGQIFLSLTGVIWARETYAGRESCSAHVVVDMLYPCLQCSRPVNIPSVSL
jgi:hypothetical protein